MQKEVKSCEFWLRFVHFCRLIRCFSVLHLFGYYAVWSRTVWGAIEGFVVHFVEGLLATHRLTIYRPADILACNWCKGTLHWRAQPYVINDRAQFEEQHNPVWLKAKTGVKLKTLCKMLSMICQLITKVPNNSYVLENQFWKDPEPTWRTVVFAVTTPPQTPPTPPAPISIHWFPNHE